MAIITGESVEFGTTNSTCVVSVDGESYVESPAVEDAAKEISKEAVKFDIETCNEKVATSIHNAETSFGTDNKDISFARLVVILGIIWVRK
jgi:hypothetical protein